jgi:nucleotide-binding universal stress UspA family protein
MIKTVFVAVDFSPVSAEVIAAAADLTGALQGRLVLGHVVQIPSSVVNFQLAGEDISNLVAGAERDAEQRLAALSRNVADIPVETVCMTGLPPAEVCREARERRADLIVVGSHGHGALYEFLVGTTTQGILRDAACPVLIIPAVKARAAHRRAAHS